jgi:hypothetical protein
MSNPNDSSKLASIKTYMLIAFIFNIIALIGFALGALWEIYVYATWAPYYDIFGSYVSGLATGFLITGIVFLVFAVMAIIVFMRVRKMYNAVNAGDIQTLKQYNNMMWAILALIFAGVLPGIMLIISVGPINELGQAPASYAPPPPPPT